MLPNQKLQCSVHFASHHNVICNCQPAAVSFIARVSIPSKLWNVGSMLALLCSGRPRHMLRSRRRWEALATVTTCTAYRRCLDIVAFNAPNGCRRECRLDCLMTSGSCMKKRAFKVGNGSLLAPACWLTTRIGLQALWNLDNNESTIQDVLLHQRPGLPTRPYHTKNDYPILHPAKFLPNKFFANHPSMIQKKKYHPHAGAKLPTGNAKSVRSNPKMHEPVVTPHIIMDKSGELHCHCGSLVSFARNPS